MGMGAQRTVTMNLCYHGNDSVAMVTKKCLLTQRTLLIGSCNSTNKALGEGQGASNLFDMEPLNIQRNTFVI